MSSEAWTVEEALNNLNQAIGDKGMSVESFFEEIDADGDGSINGPELHKGIRSIVGDLLSPGQVSQIIKAFDENEDHRIDLSELKTALSGNGPNEEE
ncbi:MAG: EF-hand domain-containing protein [Euryarchaeota archaeon]|nr:EF-hand domain-containing protein [Euryarchaeota archaeon]